MRHRQGDGYQSPYGEFGVNNWGAGDTESEYAVGDIVFIPPACSAILSGRVGEPGVYRVTAQFSIGEDASFYYRVSPIVFSPPRGTKAVTNYAVESGRLQVIPGQCDYTAGWFLLHAADRTAERELRAKRAGAAVPLATLSPPYSACSSPFRDVRST